jgi:ABC-2 type transport system ATP-binding protein
VTASDPIITVEGVEKSFGSTRALAGVDLAVERGTVLGLLGRNGAGKTTLVRILATLLVPDAGRVRVAGADVVRRAQTVRSLIGFAGQSSAVDETLTGRENLQLVGRLYGLRRSQARGRADETLERLSLTEAADRLVRTYSGGMRRRLDLGASLVGHPMVLLMDEPTTGLDPRTRVELWTFIEELVRQGTTVLLTTQYLEEADRLADRIAVIERGRVIAAGTPDELKQHIGGDVLEVRATSSGDVERLVGLLDGLGSGAPVADLRGQRVTLPTSERVQTLLAAARRIEECGIAVDDLGVRRPSLDDVFLNLTRQIATEPPPVGPLAPSRDERLTRKQTPSQGVAR